MPFNAENVTPGQTRHFRVEILGFNPFQVKQANIPDIEHDSVETGDGQSMQKFPGLTKTGDVTLKDVVDAFHKDDEILKWLFNNGNPALGAAATPYDKRDGRIVRTDAGGADVQVWAITGAWVKKVSGYSFDKDKSENIMREVVLSVDSCVPEF